MRRPWRPALTALLLSGCGGSATTGLGIGGTPCARAAATPSAAATAASAGAVTVRADRTVLTVDDSVALTVDVSGPLSLHADCGGPAGFVVLDTGDVHVAADAPPATTGVRCGDVALGPGERATYALRWSPDPTIPSGSYRIVVTAGDQPPVTLGIRLTPRPGEVC